MMVAQPSSLKRCLSPAADGDSKRCKREALSKLTDKFTLHRGRLHKLVVPADTSICNKENVPPKVATDTPLDVDAAPWAPKAKQHFRVVTTDDRNYYVAALYTLTNNLGLAHETVHMAIDLLDRFLKVQPITIQWLEVVSIACIWIACKFNETQAAIESLRVKQILQQRHRRGNWSWHHVLVIECQILKRLGFRILHPTMLSRFQKLPAMAEMTPTQLADALYFIDLTLMDASFRSFSPTDVLEAVVFLTTEFKPQQNFDFEGVEPRLREPLTGFFMQHLHIQQELADGEKLHKSLHCKHGAAMSPTWRLMASTAPCVCRICTMAPAA
ncbi:hypothetical protein SDRG_06200 [Saprolegnia diclina VS20]|uniref:Cyclin N-terminal domain-containing protein n=1 Tax=Saprolegnia diclina (strain VS20) TaxID=1156394 RepID=T0QMZ7_SAPDV|nr:hypothetical protein SDRG_06200 [Saprolegnia diclina VS20]EQC36081.1 hypothetical protein SDRG_06200 [Saprolegnia diclina VS20]|eukprot:XP_008610187.1 hypothetical protein SDRG_06200 [Saprolegnia diclina VS20]